jgi:hypothetical protein
VPGAVYCMYAYAGVEFHLAFQIRNMAQSCCIMRVVYYVERAPETHLVKEYNRKREIETP